MAVDRVWYTALVNDDGTNLVGTVWNKAAVNSLLDAVDLGLASEVTARNAAIAAEATARNTAIAAKVDTVIASTVTGAVHNWAPGLAGHTLVRWSGAADAAFTGLAGGVAGQRVTVKNIGAFVATFAHQSGSSSAGNKWLNLVTVGPTPIAPGGWITYIYNGTDWSLMAHEQGSWITPPYAAGNFTANGSMTWTVDAGDVLVNRYRLSGNTLFWVAQIATSTIGGTLNNQLLFATPGGFSLALSGAYFPTPFPSGGYAAPISGTQLALYNPGNANYAALTNASYNYFSVFFQVL